MAQRGAVADSAGRAVSAGHPQVSTGSARSLLLTILGEFVMPNTNSVWTASLLYVLTGLGI